MCSVGPLWAYLGDFGAAHRTTALQPPPTVKKKMILTLEGRRAGTRWDPDSDALGSLISYTSCIRSSACCFPVCAAKCCFCFCFCFIHFFSLPLPVFVGEFEFSVFFFIFLSGCPLDYEQL